MATKTERFLGMLGLCARARRLICGTPMICDALRQAKRGSTPVLIFEAADTSANTHKRITDRCAFYETECVRLDMPGDALAHAVGHSGSLAAVAVTDAKMADALRAILCAEE